MNTTTVKDKLRNEYNDLLCEVNLQFKSYTENKFGQSEKVYCDDNGKYILQSKSDLSKDELVQYCLLQQTSYLRTIKRCAIFFTALIIIALIIYVFYYLSLIK